jgi:hypothetical protein
VSDDLRGRADDIVWRVRCGEQHVYLLIEFQSSVETFMAVRVLTYVGLLYQDLIRAGEVARDGRLPAVLPIVLYNGSARWKAAEELSGLLQRVPTGLEGYGPQQRYLLIDEGSFDDSVLACDHNLVAMLFRIENCRQRNQIEPLVRTLVEWLRDSGQESLRRAFAVWLEKVILKRLSSESVSAMDDLREAQAMLSEQFDIWEEELRQEGRQEGEAKLLIRQLRKRFGELPDSVRARVSNAQPDQLEQWGERMFDVPSLGELFNA